MASQQHCGKAVGLLLTGVLCLTCNLGCLAPLQGLSDPASPTGPGDANAAKPELAPAAAVKVSFTVAEEMEKTGHYAEAVVFYERARQSDAQQTAWPWTDHVHVSRKLARLYDRLGDTPHALAEYQQALKESPRDASLLNSFGYFYYSRGKWAEAEEQLRHALSIDPRHKRAWVNLGLTLGEQGRFPESLEAFRKAVSEAEAHSNLAFILTTQGKRGGQARISAGRRAGPEPGHRPAGPGQAGTPRQPEGSIEIAGPRTAGWPPAGASAAAHGAEPTGRTGARLDSRAGGVAGSASGRNEPLRNTFAPLSPRARERRSNKSSSVNSKLFVKIPLPNGHKVGMLLSYLATFLPAISALQPRRLHQGEWIPPFFPKSFGNRGPFRRLRPGDCPAVNPQAVTAGPLNCKREGAYVDLGRSRGGVVRGCLILSRSWSDANIPLGGVGTGTEPTVTRFQPFPRQPAFEPFSFTGPNRNENHWKRGAWRTHGGSFARRGEGRCPS